MSVRVLSLVATIVLVCGCKADKCKDRPAEVEIRVVPEAALAAKVQGTKVTLNINGGAAVLTHDFPNVSDPAFVFELGEHDRPPRTLVVQVAAYDGSANTIGTGQETLSFSSDGCNFVTVSVTPGSAPDAGTDLLPADGGVQDGDLDAGPDAAVDADMDAAPDAAADADMDAAPDSIADAAGDAGPDIGVDAGGPCPGAKNGAVYGTVVNLNGPPLSVGGYAVKMTGAYGVKGSGYYGVIVDVECGSNGSAVATDVHLQDGGPTVVLDVPGDGKRIKLLNVSSNPNLASMTVIVENLPAP